MQDVLVFRPMYGTPFQRSLCFAAHYLSSLKTCFLSFSQTWVSSFLFWPTYVFFDSMNQLIFIGAAFCSCPRVLLLSQLTHFYGVFFFLIVLSRSDIPPVTLLFSFDVCHILSSVSCSIHWLPILPTPTGPSYSYCCHSCSPPSCSLCFISTLVMQE